MLEKMLNILFPPCCVMCGKEAKNWICPKCKILLREELKFKTIVNNYRTIYFLGFYEKRIKKLILDFKFKEKSYIGKVFPYLFLLNVEWKENFRKYDFIIPVPMFKKSKRLRGYNQSEILAKDLSTKLKVQYQKDILCKIKNNRKQSTLSIHQREENVKNVYQIKKKEIINNKKILLIDDIYTTGNTVKSCIKELEISGAKEVDVLVIAKTKTKI